jgi:hypothetical protein
MRSLRHERVLFLSKRTIDRGDRRVASAPWSHAATARPLIRTLKENLLWLHTFDTVEELRQALLAFRETYNSTWLIQRHGFRPPDAIRANQPPPAALAA